MPKGTGNGDVLIPIYHYNTPLGVCQVLFFINLTFLAVQSLDVPKHAQKGALSSFLF